jgi:excisionase family DNA binding protein
VKLVSDDQLTTSELADLLQVNPSSVKKWVDDGRLIAFRTPGGHRRIRAADFVTFLNKHQMPIPAALQDAAKKRVLVVDDDATQLKGIARGLKKYEEKIDVTTSSNAVDALVLLGSLRPHAVLLDSGMAGIDTLEAVRTLKKNEATSEIAVYLVGSFTSATEQKAKAAGAAGVVPKPVDAKHVASLLFPEKPEPTTARKR